MQSYILLSGRKIFSWEGMAQVLPNLSWIFGWIFPKIQESHTVSLRPSSLLCIQEAGWNIKGCDQDGSLAISTQGSESGYKTTPFFALALSQLCLSPFLDYELLEGRMVSCVHFLTCMASTWETLSTWLHKKDWTRKGHRLTVPSVGKNGEKQELRLLPVGL